MNRRHAVAGLAGLLAAFARGRHVPANEGGTEKSGGTALRLKEQLKIGVRSSAVDMGDASYSMVNVASGTFRLDDQSRLTATLRAAIIQFADIDYWIYVAVFDAERRLLGAASHKEAVRRVRLGDTLTVFSDIRLDFGISEAFREAAAVEVAVSERDVATPK